MGNEEKIIYSLCDYSGEWSKPYRENGYRVYQIDLKFGDDVRLLHKPNHPVYGVLAAPMCTVFANSGAKWYALRPYQEVLEGLSIVDACIRFIYATKPKGFHSLENPVGCLDWYLGEPTFKFDPCDYGDPYTKKTCLWGDFIPPLKNPVEPTEGSKIHLRYGGRSEKTKTMRSITPPGFARAFYEANK
jgi:hypothetical protein